MKLLELKNEYQISRWAYYQCSSNNNTEEIRSLITDGYYSYLYCYYINNRTEIRKNISDKEFLRILEKRRSYETNR